MDRISTFFKTTILFAALTALLIVVGYMIGGKAGAYLFFIISLVMNLGSYWFSDKIALAMAHARPISEQEAPDLYADVRDLASRMNLPMPSIHLSPEMQPNAFATGRNPKHAAVAVTAGILQVLDRNELRAVLAHELGHVKHRDVLLVTVAAVIAGAISSLAQLAMWFGGGRDREDSNPFAQLLVLLLAPITATIIQLAISRSREYAADDAAKEFADPRALAGALSKIEQYVAQVPMNVNPSLSPLYIQNPFKNKSWLSLFSTHPPTFKRVARLLGISDYQAQELLAR